MSNVIIVFPKIEDGKNLKNILMRNGIQVMGVFNSGYQALSAIDGLNDGIVVCGYKFTDMLYRDLLINMPQSFEMLLVVSKLHMEEAESMGVRNIVMPLKVAELIESINIISDNLYIKRRRKREKPKKRSDADKKIIESAKMLLMDRNDYTEEEAHKYIQKCSMDTGTNMVETAKMILRLMV